MPCHEYHASAGAPGPPAPAPGCCAFGLQAGRNNLLPAFFYDDGGTKECSCDEGVEDDEGEPKRPPAWRSATDEELARFKDVPVGGLAPVLELTPDPLEGVPVEQLLREAYDVCVTSALLRFEPCGPPSAEWAGGPAPPTYKAMWGEACG